MARGGIFSIYLSGGMNGLQEGGKDLLKSSTAWRRYVSDKIVWACPDLYKKIYCYDPTAKFSYEDIKHLTEQEVINYNYWQLKNSDIVMAYFNNPNSLGTVAEITLAKYAYGIPVLGIKPKEIEGELDFTIRNSIDRLFNDIDECLEYTFQYYLI